MRHAVVCQSAELPRGKSCDEGEKEEHGEGVEETHDDTNDVKDARNGALDEVVHVFRSSGFTEVLFPLRLGFEQARAQTLLLGVPRVTFMRFKSHFRVFLAQGMTHSEVLLRLFAGHWPR